MSPVWSTGLHEGAGTGSARLLHGDQLKKPIPHVWQVAAGVIFLWGPIEEINPQSWCGCFCGSGPCPWVLSTVFKITMYIWLT